MGTLGTTAQAITAGVSTLLGWQNQRESARRQAEALSKQAGAAVKRMDYAFQNYEMQRVDAYDAAVNNLMKVKQNSLGLLSGVRAAINEETGGDSRTGRALNRAAVGDVLRAESSIKDNYSRQSDEINLNKEAVKLQTQDEIANIKAQAPEMPSVWGLVMQMAGTGLSIYDNYLNQKVSREALLGTRGYKGLTPTIPTWGDYHFNNLLPANYNMQFPGISPGWNEDYFKSWKGIRW